MYPELINRLEKLRTIEIVQSNLSSILFSLSAQIYKTNTAFSFFQIVYKPDFEKLSDNLKKIIEYSSDKEILSLYNLESDFFKKPQNWFLPFYKNNPIIDSAFKYSYRNLNFKNIEEALNISYSMSNIDKYSFCLNIDNLSDKEIENILKLPILEAQLINELLGDGEQFNYEDFETIKIIREYYLFFKLYEKGKFIDFISNTQKINNTKLCEIILNESKRNEANNYMDEDMVKFFEVIQNPYLGPIIKEIENKNMKTAMQYFTVYLKEAGTNLNFEYFLFIARLFEDSNDYMHALEIRLKYYDFDSDNFTNLRDIGMCFQNLNEFNNALKFNILAYRKKTKDAYNCRLIARSYQEMKRFNYAIEYRLISEDLEPNNPWNLAQLAECYNNINNKLKSEYYIQKLKQQNSKDIATLGAIGYYYVSINDYNEALSYYLKCNEQSSNKFNGQIAFCYLQNNDKSNALLHALKQIEYFPNHTSSYNILALCLLASKRIKEAEEKYYESIKIETTFYNSLGIGILNLIKGNFDQSLKYFKNSINIDKNINFKDDLEDYINLLKKYSFEFKNKDIEKIITLVK